MRATTLCAALLASLLLGGLGCGPSGVCDPDALASALATAGPGDTVQVGRCEVRAPASVPQGVTLAGHGRDDTTLRVPEIASGIRLAAGAGLEALTVDTSATFGVWGREGTVGLSRVRVRARRGVAMSFDGARSVTLTDVRLEGPVTEDNVEDAPFLDPSRDETATHGLALLGVGEATLTEVDIRGFARFGAIVQDARSDGTAGGVRVQWEGGGLDTNLGYGLYASGEGTRVSLRNTHIRRTLQGLRLDPPYGAVVVQGAHISSRGLEVRDNDRYGLVLESASADHQNLIARDNGDAALWIGNSEDVALTGTSTELTGNAFAGAVVVDSRNVRLRDGRIAGTTASTRTLGAEEALGSVQVGDGVHLVGSHRDILLEDLALENNARAGLLADLGDRGGEGLTFRDVTVRSTGMQLGAVAGTTDDSDMPTSLTATGMEEWDDGITREGAAIENDADFSGEVDVAGAVTPTSLPRPADIAGAVTPTS